MCDEEAMFNVNKEIYDDWSIQQQSRQDDVTATIDININCEKIQYLISSTSKDANRS